MSAARDLIIQRGAVTIAIVSQKSISISGEGVEITGDTDNAWRTFDSFVGARAVDISVEGVTKDADLRAAILAGTPSLLMTDITATYPNGDTIAGDFWFGSFEEGGPQNDALRFSATFQSSGEIVYTAAV
jgi:predicted secreted protein